LPHHPCLRSKGHSSATTNPQKEKAQNVQIQPLQDPILFSTVYIQKTMREKTEKKARKDAKHQMWKRLEGKTHKTPLYAVAYPWS
jgi:hypothetical protein